MGRPKGSKNKPKTNIPTEVRIEQLDQEMAELTAAATALESEIDSTSAQLVNLKKELRARNRDIKKLAAKREALAAQAQEQERAQAAQEIVDKYLADGKTVEELREALGI